DSLSYQIVVFGDNDPTLVHGCGIPKIAVTVVPLPLASTLNDPPSAVTRSARLARPVPWGGFSGIPMPSSRTATDTEPFSLASLPALACARACLRAFVGDSVTT